MKSKKKMSKIWIKVKKFELENMKNEKKWKLKGKKKTSKNVKNESGIERKRIVGFNLGYQKKEIKSRKGNRTKKNEN